MSHERVFNAIKETGVPCAHMAWPKGSAPALPWCVYYLGDNHGYYGGFYADDTNYANCNLWIVELYMEYRDSEIEKKIEDAINTISPFRRYEVWVEKENCMMVSYMFTEIERGN